MVQLVVDVLVELCLEEHTETETYKEDGDKDPEHVVHFEKIGIFVEAGRGDDLRFVRVVAWVEECPRAHEQV